jgi:tRNA (guanine37-N1)-methyltransferase
MKECIQGPATMNRLRAPLGLGMTTLDRSVFSKTFNLAAASIRDHRNIAKYKNQLTTDGLIFDRPRFRFLRPHPDSTLAAAGRKCLLLREQVKPDGSSSRANA